jgi:hypothetical protein
MYSMLSLSLSLGFCACYKVKNNRKIYLCFVCLFFSSFSSLKNAKTTTSRDDGFFFLTSNLNFYDARDARKAFHLRG